LEDNIKMGFKEIELEVVNWIQVAPDKNQWRTHVNTEMSIRVSQNAENFLRS
jgi:hypothetical protein